MTNGRDEGQASLAGRKVLVVEDEYLIADDLAEMLKEAGANVVGPAASLPIAMRILDHGEKSTPPSSTSICAKWKFSRLPTGLPNRRSRSSS